MNKSQLVDALAGHFEGNKREARHALESVVDTIMREVTRGEKVAITGFGAFEKVIRPARMVRNPQTGDRTRAKKKAVPKFRPGAELRDYVSGAKKLPKAAAKSTASSSAGTANRSSSSGTAAKKSSSSGTAAKKSSSSGTAAKKSSSSGTAAKKSTSASRSGTATKKSATAKKSSTSAPATATKKSTRSSSTATRKSTARKG